MSRLIAASLVVLLLATIIATGSATAANDMARLADRVASGAEVVSALVKSTLTDNWQPRHVHLAYGYNTTEVVVTWSTLSFSGPSIVEWGTDMFSLAAASTGESREFVDGGELHSTQWINRVHLYSLTPDTTYFYHVGGDMGLSAVFGFKTVPATTDGWPLRLAVYGDLGAVNAQSLVNIQQEAHQGMYDAVVHVGDFAYDMYEDNGAVGDVFMDQIEPIAAYLPYMTCPGNHEAAYDFLQYRSRFSMPNYNVTESLYFSFDLGSVHFISITTEVYYDQPDQLKRIKEQFDWLVDNLKAATNSVVRANRPWIVLYGHRPMYCSNSNVDDCTKVNSRVRVGIEVTSENGETELMYAIEPLLAEYGVDLTIWGHEHNYERMYPMYNYTVYNVTGENPYENPGAPTHITTGSAGCREGHNPLEQEKPSWSAERFQDYGYTRMTFHNHSHMYMEQVSIDKGGDTKDRMWLVRDKHDNYPLIK